MAYVTVWRTREPFKESGLATNDRSNLGPGTQDAKCEANCYTQNSREGEEGSAWETARARTPIQPFRPAKRSDID